MITKSQSTAFFKKECESRSLYYSTIARDLCAAINEVEGELIFNGAEGSRVRINETKQPDFLNHGIYDFSFRRRNLFTSENCHQFTNAHLTIVRGEVNDSLSLASRNTDPVIDTGCPPSREATMSCCFSDTDYFDLKDEDRIDYRLDISGKSHYGWVVASALEHSLTISSWAANSIRTEDMDVIPDLTETVAGFGALILGAVVLRRSLKVNQERQFGNHQFE